MPCSTSPILHAFCVAAPRRYASLSIYVRSRSVNTSPRNGSHACAPALGAPGDQVSRSDATRAAQSDRAALRLLSRTNAAINHSFDDHLQEIQLLDLLRGWSAKNACAAGGMPGVVDSSLSDHLRGMPCSAGAALRRRTCLRWPRCAERVVDSSYAEHSPTDRICAWSLPPH